MDKKPTIAELTAQYALGHKSFRELQDNGAIPYTAILAQLGEMNLRVPIARDIGPNLETRRAGMKLLAELLAPQ